MKRTSMHKIEATLTCVSGVRVGGTGDQLEIGGLDLTVIKDPVSLRPYLPGSSLKGRMRSELEHQLGRYSNEGHEPCDCCDQTCPVCRVFGPHKFKPGRQGPRRTHPGPTRLLVRDAQLEDPTAPVNLEIKTESVNDRVTGQAGHPRPVERVAAGTKFRLRMALQVFDDDSKFAYGPATGKEALLAVVKEALGYVGCTGIGGGISRGSGEVKIEGWNVTDCKPWQ